MAIYEMDSTDSAGIMDGAGTEADVQNLILQGLAAAGLFDMGGTATTVAFDTVDGPAVDSDDFDLIVLTAGNTTAVIDTAGDPGDGVALAGTATADTVTTYATFGGYLLGSGNDYLYDAGSGNSTVLAGSGNDSLTNAGAGSDFIDAGDGADVVFDTGAGSSFIAGGQGSDTLLAGIGGDSIDGGIGDDLVIVYSGNAFVTGGVGNDFIYDLGAGNSVLYGGDGNDTIFSGFGSDTVDGGAGDDLIAVFGDTGNDTVSGGDGSDTLVILRASSELASTSSDAGGATVITFTDSSTITFAGIESVIFAS